MAETIRALVERGIPVMGHLGLTPAVGPRAGRLPGAGPGAAAPPTGCWPTREALEEAGACAIVLELLPGGARARGSREALTIPTIGIGAGPGCDGQVLVSTTCSA